MATATITLPRTSNAGKDAALIAFWVLTVAMIGRANTAPFLLYGLAGGAVLIARHMYSVWLRGEESEGNLVIAALAPIFLLASGLSLQAVTKYTPETYDGLLATIDCGAAAAIRGWAQSRAWVMTPVLIAYFAFPLAMLTAISHAKGTERKRLMIAAALGGLLVIPWYFILPACGPAHLHDRNAPRNCVPSMHSTWALLIFTNSKGWAKWPAGVFAAVTLLATIATGEHYTPDLVAALPWTWTLNKLAGKAL